MPDRIPSLRFPLLAFVAAACACVLLVVAGCNTDDPCGHDHKHRPGCRPYCVDQSEPCPPEAHARPRPYRHRFQLFRDNVDEADEVKSQAAVPGPVDPEKLAEEKGGRFRIGFRQPAGRYRYPVYSVPNSNCLNCPPVGPVVTTTPGYVATPYYLPRAPEQPAARPTGGVPDFSRAPRGEVKTGGFACSNCGRITVGADWQTEWVRGEPITFCCRACWESMSPLQRRACYENWTRRQNAAPAIGGPVGTYPTK